MVCFFIVSDLQNKKVAPTNLCPRTQSHEEVPLLDQKRRDEDDEGAGPASEPTEKEDQQVSNKPDSDETEASGPLSVAEEPGLGLFFSLIKCILYHKCYQL